MPVILFVNLKGGVAKTTSTVALAECLAEQNKKVLVIDADHQCMAGELLLGENRMLKCEQHEATLHDLLREMVHEDFAIDSFSAYVQSSCSNIGDGFRNLSVMPCSIRIDEIQSNMAKARQGMQTYEEFEAMRDKRRKAFGKWLRMNYEYVFVDCPPSLAWQVKFLMPIADTFIIPCVPDRLSVRGANWLLRRIAKTGVKRPCLGVLWTLYREQNKVHRHVVERTEKRNKPFDELPRPFKTIIPNAAAIAAAHEDEIKPRTFNEKYSPTFSKKFREIAAEIDQRCRQQIIRPA
jgi:chromosome partitioning protein